MVKFKFRDKKETIGIFLGSVCFLPAFFTVYYLGLINLTLSIIILIITQGLWLTSITLYTWSLNIENRQLKAKLDKENSNYHISHQRIIKAIDCIGELEEVLKKNDSWNEYLWREIITIQCLLMYDDNDNSIYDS